MSEGWCDRCEAEFADELVVVNAGRPNEESYRLCRACVDLAVVCTTICSPIDGKTKTE